MLTAAASSDNVWKRPPARTGAHRLGRREGTEPSRNHRLAITAPGRSALAPWEGPWATITTTTAPTSTWPSRRRAGAAVTGLAALALLVPACGKQMIACRPPRPALFVLAMAAGAARGRGLRRAPSAGVATLRSATTTTQTSSSQTAGSGGSTAEKYKAALAYVDCMRSHGVSNFPDPSSDGRINVQFALAERMVRRRRAVSIGCHLSTSRLIRRAATSSQAGSRRPRRTSRPSPRH